MKGEWKKRWRLKLFTILGASKYQPTDCHNATCPILVSKTVVNSLFQILCLFSKLSPSHPFFLVSL